MMPDDTTLNPDFYAYAGLLWRHHVLSGIDGAAGPELDNLEDEMDALWERLDNVQRRHLNGMSSDLNWLRRKGRPAPMNCKADDEQGEPQPGCLGILHRLRRETSIIPAEIALLRGKAYGDLGLPDWASVFKSLGWELIDGWRSSDRHVERP